MGAKESHDRRPAEQQREEARVRDADAADRFPGSLQPRVVVVFLREAVDPLGVRARNQGSEDVATERADDERVFEVGQALRSSTDDECYSVLLLFFDTTRSYYYSLVTSYLKDPCYAGPYRAVVGRPEEQRVVRSSVAVHDRQCDEKHRAELERQHERHGEQRHGDHPTRPLRAPRVSHLAREPGRGFRQRSAQLLRRPAQRQHGRAAVVPRGLARLAWRGQQRVAGLGERLRHGGSVMALGLARHGLALGSFLCFHFCSVWTLRKTGNQWDCPFFARVH